MAYQYFQGIFRKSPSWHRVLPLVAIKAPYRRLGTVRRLNGAGLLLYFSYGRWHSVLAKRGSVPFEGDRRRPKPLDNVFSCRQEEVDLRPLNGGALGLNAESPIEREPSGRPRRSTRGTSRM
jgi:hypothetical protein